MRSGGDDHLRRDLIVGAVVLVAVWLTAIYLDLFEILDDLIHRNEHWQFDEILVAVLSLSMLASWFSYRRWQDSVDTQRLSVASEQKYRALVESSSDWIWEVDQHGVYTYASPQVFEMLGYQPEEIIGKTPFDLMSADEVERLQFEFTAIASDMRSIHGLENTNLHKNGSLVVLETNGRPIIENGQLLGYRGIGRDITERKTSEQLLQQAQSRYEEAQHVAHLGFWELDLISHDLAWTKENYLLFGGKPGDKNSYEAFLERIHPDDLDYVNQAYTGSVEDRTPYDVEHRLLMPDGSVKWVHEQCQTFYDEEGKAIRSTGTTQDITKRKLAEIEMQESRARFAGIVEMAADAIISINEKQKITLFNKAAEVMFDCSAEAVLGEPVIRLIPQRFHASHSGLVETFMNSDDQRHVHRKSGMIGQRMNGEEFPIESSISKQVIDGETIMTVMIRDLSEQVKAQDIQRKLLRAIAEAGEAVIITDTQAVIEYVNPAFSEITGYEVEEAIGNTPAMLKSDAQDPSFYKELWETISSGNVWHGTLIDRRKDGSFYPALMSVSPIYDEYREITHYVSLQQDMTEYKKLEGQFLQAQKMEAVGTLVGGIAHDFNNMLAAIQGNAYLARMRMKHGDLTAVDEKIGNVEQITSTAAEMVKQLLTFARKDSVSMVDLPLGPYLKEALKLGGSAIPENIELLSDITGEELHVHGDSTQLQQLVMNLLNNARDAVADATEPKISLSLTRSEPGNDFLLQHPELSGAAMALLSVADNGIGISENNLQKVFEPFFTTKGVGKGTGLGLAMVFGAVQRHGGVIEVESIKNSGTTFRIYLPLLTKRVEKMIGVGSKMVMGMNETILLVDDEPVLRRTTSELLNNIGYRVLEAGDGEEALQMFSAQTNEISLIISDIVMPKMGGVELAEEVRRLDNDMPIIFVTGYDKERALSVSQGIDCNLVLNKPFNIEYLSHAIRDMLAP